MLLKTLLTLTVTTALALGCAQDTPNQAKPEADPDVATLSAGKADAVSNWWTTIVGELTLGETAKTEIDWPDWFHGYTLELNAGQTARFAVSATEKGYARLYGPASKIVDGEPRFKRALVKTSTEWLDGAWRVTFDYEVEDDGIYMVLYGPKLYWHADYTIETECLGGCQPNDACEEDDECADAEYCEHNGVYCFAYPCAASYNICWPREEAGGGCNRDRMCADGLVCDDSGTCSEPKVDGVCETNDDCAEGFCACADMGCTVRECRPFSAEGESCGGYVPANLVKMCAPEYQCVAPSFIADIPGNCGAEVDAKHLFDNGKDYDGRFVSVSGWIHDGFAMCTKMGCSQDNPCCNSCSAQQLLYPTAQEPTNMGFGIRLTQEDEPFSCSGNDCDWADNCTVDSGHYWLAGWFDHDGETGEMTLEVVRRFYAPIW